MQRCSTCKHWEGNAPDIVERVCLRVVDKTSPEQAPAPYLLRIGIGCLTTASLLYTPATFGCTLHEPKEPG